jgi:SAM-dependent methyltransferase
MTPNDTNSPLQQQDVDAERQWHEQPFFLESQHWTAHPLLVSREQHWLHNDVQTERFYASLYRYQAKKQQRRDVVVLLAPVGNGRDYYFLQNVFASIRAVHGIDLSPQALAACPRAVETREGDILKSGYEDGTFDVVICSQFLHHVHAAGFAPFLGEFHRILRPGGSLAILEPGDLHPIWRVAQLARRFMGNVTGLVEGERPVRPSQVTRALEQTGFEQLQMHPLLFTHVRLPMPLQHLLDAADYPLRLVPGVRNFANSFGWYCSKAIRSR